MSIVLFARCRYEKAPEFRTRLTVELQDGRKVVCKRPAAPEARAHLARLAENESRVRAFVGGRAEVLQGEALEDGGLRYPFVDLPTIEYLLAEALDAGDERAAEGALDRAVGWIRALPTEEADPTAHAAFAGLYGDGLGLFPGRVPCLALGLLDLNADNLLHDRDAGRFVLIDQELVLDCPVPVEVVVFRCVFFAMAKMGNVLDLQADRLATKVVGEGLLRVPAGWDVARWVEEARVEPLLRLEERFQSRFTGREVAWPRPAKDERIEARGRQRRNVADRLVAQHEELRAAHANAAAQLVAAEAASSARIAKVEWDAATRVAEVEKAAAAAGEALARELGLARAAERRALRRLSVASDRDRQAILWLEGELHGARERLGRPLSVRVRGRLTALGERVAPLPAARRLSRAMVRHGVVGGARLAVAATSGRMELTLKRAARRALGRTAPAPAAPPPVVAQGAAPDVPHLVYGLGQATRWAGPLVSVVVATSEDGPSGTAATLEAVRRQTFGDVETVLWDEEKRRAWVVERPEAWWTVAEDADLGPTLLGKYALVATPSLAALPAAAVELAVMALEGEDLDVAVNVAGPLAEAQRAFDAGRLPGPHGDEAPLVVARAETLEPGRGLRLDRLPGRHATAHVFGRLVAHPPRPGVAAPAAWSGTTAAGAASIARVERSLLRRAPERERWDAVPVYLRSIDGCLSTEPVPATRPRVLVLFPFLAVGGAERLTLDVLAALRDRYEFVVATVEGADESLGTMLGEYREVTPFVFPLPDAIAPHLNFSALAYLVERYGVESLFVANGSGWIYDAAESIRTRFPGLHMVNQVYDHRMGWIDRYDAALVRVFDRHVAPNPRIAEAYVARGVAPDRVDLVYHGIETAPYDPAAYPPQRVAELKRRFGLPEDRPVVGFLARMHPQKRPHDFVALAQRFRPEEATFVLVGDGPLAEAIDGQVARLALPHLVRLPFHKPFADVLAACDVVVVLSQYEGLPLVLLHAQAMGRPVVATDVGAIREVLEHTGGGIVVDRIGDVGAVEKAVRRALAGRPDVARVRARVVERFDVSVAAKLYGESFRRR